MSKKRKRNKRPEAPAGYRWVINEQERFIDVQLVKADHKKRPAVDAFCILRLDRSDETMEELLRYRMMEVICGLPR